MPHHVSLPLLGNLLISLALAQNPELAYNCAKLPAICNNVNSKNPISGGILDGGPIQLTYAGSGSGNRGIACPSNWKTYHTCPEPDQPLIVGQGQSVDTGFVGQQWRMGSLPTDPDFNVIADPGGDESGMLWTCDEWPPNMSQEGGSNANTYCAPQSVSCSSSARGLIANPVASEQDFQSRAHAALARYATTGQQFDFNTFFDTNSQAASTAVVYYTNGDAAAGLFGKRDFGLEGRSTINDTKRMVEYRYAHNKTVHVQRHHYVWHPKADLSLENKIRHRARGYHININDVKVDANSNKREAQPGAAIVDRRPHPSAAPAPAPRHPAPVLPLYARHFANTSTPAVVPESTTDGASLSTITPTAVSTTTTDTIPGVTGNTEYTSTNDDGSETVIPVLTGCSFCPAAGLLLLPGVGPAPGVYPIPGGPVVTIGPDGIPTADAAPTDAPTVTSDPTSETSSSTTSSASDLACTSDVASGDENDVSGDEITSYLPDGFITVGEPTSTPAPSSEPASSTSAEPTPDPTSTPPTDPTTTEPAPPAQTSFNNKGSALCKSAINHEVCVSAYSRYEDDRVYTGYTSYTFTDGDSDFNWAFGPFAYDGCTAIYTCEDAPYDQPAASGAMIKGFFDELYASEDVNTCGSSYLSNGCHVTLNGCQDCKDEGI